MIHDFQTYVADPRQKEANRLCFELLRSEGDDVMDVSEDHHYYKRGIDILKIEPQGEITIDVKCDFQAHATKNIVVEFIEVLPMEGNTIKLGWAYTPIDVIYYVIWETKELFILDKTFLKEISFSKERRAYSALHHKPFSYFTLGILIPLEEIRHIVTPKIL